MYDIRFCYADGSYQDFTKIKSITYISYEKSITISGDEIISHSFPLGKDFQLISDDANYTVSGDNLKFIQVTKQN